jgi:hypothetical protein
MTKKRDVVVVADDDDDEVRTSASQNERQQHCVLRNFSSGLRKYSSPLISAERWGEGHDIDSQRDTYKQSRLSFRCQLNLQTAEQDL